MGKDLFLPLPGGVRSHGPFSIEVAVVVAGWLTRRLIAPSAPPDAAPIAAPVGVATLEEGATGLSCSDAPNLTEPTARPRPRTRDGGKIIHNFSYGKCNDLKQCCFAYTCKKLTLSRKERERSAGWLCLIFKHEGFTKI